MPTNLLTNRLRGWHGRAAKELSHQILAKLGLDGYLSRFYANQLTVSFICMLAIRKPSAFLVSRRSVK